MQTMKYIVSILMLAAVFAAMPVPVVAAPVDTQRQKDSLWQIVARTQGKERRKAREKLVGIYRVDLDQGALDTMKTLFDAMEADARAEGDLKTQGVVVSNRISTYFNARLLDDVIAEAPACLEFLARNELWKDYYQLYGTLISSFRIKGEYDKALSEAEKLYGIAKEREDQGGMGMAMLAYSRIYSAQRRFAEAETCIRECIDLLQGETLYLNFLATAYNKLATDLIGQRRYDEAFQVARETEAVNRRYEQASKSPQPSAWYNLWLSYVDIYRQTAEFNEAQRYVDKIDSITRGSVKMYKERGHILYGKGRYREAIAMLDKAIESFPNSLENKGLKLMTLARMREAEKALELFSEVVYEQEARHNEAYNAKLDELRTQYEVDKYIAEKERNRNYFLFSLGGCMLLAILLGVAFYHNRVVTRKNIGLYNRIREQDRLEEELALAKAMAATSSADNAAAEPEVELPGDWQQRELVDRLHDYLLRDRNLIQAEVNRDKMVAALGTNKNNLTEAVKVVTGKTPMEYIRSMQLEEARHLLDKYPELTVEAVAFDCGFNAANTFYRLFRKQYGISPAEYRKIARSLGN